MSTVSLRNAGLSLTQDTKFITNDIVDYGGSDAVLELGQGLKVLTVRLSWTGTATAMVIDVLGTCKPGVASTAMGPLGGTVTASAAELTAGLMEFSVQTTARLMAIKANTVTTAGTIVMDTYVDCQIINLVS
jgi:hypothetical protein